MSDATVGQRPLREAALEFLSQPRIAVAGVSRDTKQPANLVYRRLRAADHRVFAVNPNASSVEGDPCYASVGAIPETPDGVVIVTPAEATSAVVEDCIAAGVPRVWFHRGLGPGSAEPGAIARAREAGLSVIPGGCPNMFGGVSDPGHRLMCRCLQAFGRIPRRV